MSYVTVVCRDGHSVEVPTRVVRRCILIVPFEQHYFAPADSNTIIQLPGAFISKRG